MDAYYYTAENHYRLTSTCPNVNFSDATLLVNWIRLIKSENEYQMPNKEKSVEYNLLNTNISNGLNPDQSSWDKISDLAFRTFVPESEESREKGAGGGDAND